MGIILNYHAPATVSGVSYVGWPERRRPLEPSQAVVNDVIALDGNTALHFAVSRYSSLADHAPKRPQRAVLSRIPTRHLHPHHGAAFVPPAPDLPAMCLCH